MKAAQSILVNPNFALTQNSLSGGGRDSGALIIERAMVVVQGGDDGAASDGGGGGGGVSRIMWVGAPAISADEEGVVRSTVNCRHRHIYTGCGNESRSVAETGRRLTKPMDIKWITRKSRKSPGPARWSASSTDRRTTFPGQGSLPSSLGRATSCACA